MAISVSVLAVCILILYLARPLVTYLRDPNGLRKYPSPSLLGIPAFAGWSNWWLAIVIARQARSINVQQAHDQHGSVVRIQPDHLSFNTGAAVKDIYGFQSKMTKGGFYKTFTEPDVHGRIFESIVSTSDREEHARKRKYISYAFSQQNIIKLTPIIQRRISNLVQHLDRMTTGNYPLCTSPQENNLDLYRWINFLFYDISAELTFGEPLGQCDKGNDLLDALPFDGSAVHQISGVDAFQSSGSYSAFFGPWPLSNYRLKRLTRWHWNSQKGKHYGEFVHQYLQRRLRRGETKEFRDFVSYLLQDRQGKSLDLEYPELLTEVNVILAAGIDLLASTTTNALYHLLKNPRCLNNLRAELDANLEKSTAPTFEQVSQLPYLKAVLEETLRDRPPIPQGLPRVVPQGGAHIEGQFIKEGTTVSVPLFSLHHNPTIFSDPWEFLPERWLDKTLGDTREYCLPFSLGPRACTGRNLAYTEIPLIIATLIHRYDFTLPSPNWKMEWKEPLNMNPTSLPVRIARRVV